MQRKIITTADGSHTVHVEDWNVTYHSHHGAVQESMHVFINAGLRHWLAQNENPHRPVRIFEMGFGTGLNAYLTAIEATVQHKAIHYTAVEAYPVSPEEAGVLNYAQGHDEKALFVQLHHSVWETNVFVNPFFTLYKAQLPLADFTTDNKFDIVYFDAFAPATQPELWTEDIFRKLVSMMAANAVLVTYCSKGVVRRAMQAAGFSVAKIPGPKGKREMVRATLSRL